MAIRVGIIGVGWGSVVQVPAFRVVPEWDDADVPWLRSGKPDQRAIRERLEAPVR
jgi:hypothetical protein